MMIVKEGTLCTKLHLVMKGEALLKSTRSPIESEVGPFGEMQIKDNNSKVITKKGYISDTVNTFHIGMKTEKQWIGEESLVIEEGGIYPYSAIAINNVSTLEILASDFKTKLPRDYISKFLSFAKTKYEYLISRMKAISKTSKQIYNIVEKQSLYNEVYKKAKDKHPNASKNVLINIGNYDLKGMSILSPSSIHNTILNKTSRKAPEIPMSMIKNQGNFIFHSISYDIILRQDISTIIR